LGKSLRSLWIDATSDGTRGLEDLEFLSVSKQQVRGRCQEGGVEKEAKEVREMKRM
jgi:hypothetical protein